MMELAQGYDEELKEKLDDEIPDREFLPHLKDLCLVTLALQYVHDGEPLQTLLVHTPKEAGEDRSIADSVFLVLNRLD